VSNARFAFLGTLLSVFRLWERPGMFPLALSPIDLTIGAPAFASGPLRVSTASNAHGAMPNFAVRVDVETSALVYSSDTQPSEAVVALSRGADVLVHEATFSERDRIPGRGATHSSAADAGRVAAAAGVGRLILTHVGPDYHADIDALAREARQHFTGSVEVAADLHCYPLSSKSNLGDPCGFPPTRAAEECLGPPCRTSERPGVAARDERVGERQPCRGPTSNRHERVVGEPEAER
jgi:hypothetical protein